MANLNAFPLASLVIACGCLPVIALEPSNASMRDALLGCWEHHGPDPDPGMIRSYDEFCFAAQGKGYAFMVGENDGVEYAFEYELRGAQLEIWYAHSAREGLGRWQIEQITDRRLSYIESSTKNEFERKCSKVVVSGDEVSCAAPQ